MKTSAFSRIVFLAALSAAAAFTVSARAQEFRFQFDPENFRFEREDQRGNDAKRASCATYAQIAVVQADANRRYNCGYRGGRWDPEARAHFRWCRFVSRERKIREQIERSRELQACFDRIGDFDEDREERREEWRDDRR